MAPPTRSTTRPTQSGKRPLVVDAQAASCCTPVMGSVLSEADAAALAASFKALADPVRLRLLSVVANAPSGEVCACDLPEVLDRSQPTVSHHLSTLVDAGLVHREQRGKWAWFRLVPDRLTALQAVLAPPGA